MEEKEPTYSFSTSKQKLNKDVWSNSFQDTRSSGDDGHWHLKCEKQVRWTLCCSTFYLTGALGHIQKGRLQVDSCWHLELRRWKWDEEMEVRWGDGRGQGSSVRRMEDQTVKRCTERAPQIFTEYPPWVFIHLSMDQCVCVRPEKESPQTNSGTRAQWTPKGKNNVCTHEAYWTSQYLKGTEYSTQKDLSSVVRDT